MQAELESAVSRHNNAYRVALDPLIERVGGAKQAWPDGIHFSPAMHEQVAVAIAVGCRGITSAARTSGGQ